MSVDFLIWHRLTLACVGGWGGSVAIRKKINKLLAGLVGPYREIFPSVSKTSLGLRPEGVFETLGNISLYRPLNRQITYIYFFICACLLIFFYFLQSDWLQQRAAFYDILTVVQKCYFFKTDQGVELIVELE